MGGLDPTLRGDSCWKQQRTGTRMITTRSKRGNGEGLEGGRMYATLIPCYPLDQFGSCQEGCANTSQITQVQWGERRGITNRLGQDYEWISCYS